MADKSSMGRKPHYDVTATDAQPHSKSTLKHEMSEAMPGGDYAPKTPSGMFGGLRGTLADRPSNQSNSKAVGAGANARNQSSQSGMGGGGKYIWPTGPDTTVSSDSDNENFGSMSTNNIHGKGPKQPKTHKYE